MSNNRCIIESCKTTAYNMGPGVTLFSVVTVEEENKKLLRRVIYLEEQLEAQNRNARCTSIELRNIPQSEKETKNELKEALKNTADILSITITNSEIKDIYRINTKAAVKPIVADFTTVSARDTFIASFKKYNKEHRGTPLNSSNIKIPGPSKPIYISENLTPRDRRLNYLAREFAAAHGYKYCWISYGKIYLRKAEGAPAIRVTSEADIEKLRQNCPTNPEMRSKWFKLLKNKCFMLDWSKSKICSKHFEHRYFDSQRKLKDTALPTLFGVNVNQPPVRTFLDRQLARMSQADLTNDVKNSYANLKEPSNLNEFITDDLQCKSDAPVVAKLWLMVKKQNNLITRLTDLMSQTKKHVDILQTSVSESKSVKKDQEHDMESLKYIVKCLQEKHATLEEQIEILTAVESR